MTPQSNHDTAGSFVTVFAWLTRLQLRGYFHALGTTLRQYRLWIFLFVVLIAFGINVVLDPIDVGLPLFNATRAGADLTPLISTVMLANAIGALWYFAQAAFIRQIPFETYLNTLAISLRLRRCALLTLLAVSDLLLWIPVIFALWLIFSTTYSTACAPWYALVKLAGLCWLVLLLQICLATQQYKKVCCLALLNAGWVASTQLTPWLTSLSIICIAMIGLWLCLYHGMTPSQSANPHRKIMPFKHVPMPTALTIQLHIVHRYFTNFLLRISVIVVLQGFLFEWLRHMATTHPMPWVGMSIINMFTCTVLFGFTKSLWWEHRKTMAYTATLPLSKHYWFWRDYFCLLGMTFALQAPMIGYAIIHFAPTHSVSWMTFGILQSLLMLGLNRLNRTSWHTRTQTFAIILWVVIMIYLSITFLP